MAKRIGLILSGCGVFDGSEIHEAVLSLLYLKKKGYDVVCMAPDIEQAHVFDHQNGSDAAGEKRNVMTESARIARGAVEDIGTVNVSEFDGFFFPGGFGAAKNLCTYAFDQSDAKVNEDVAKLIRDAHGAKKPLGFVCIAPVLAARVLGNGVEVTLGTDQEMASHIEKMDGKHIMKQVNEAHTDKLNKVVSSPAYNLASDIIEADQSISAAVDAFAKLLD